MFQLSKCKVKDHPQVSMKSHDDYEMLCQTLNGLKGKSLVYEALLDQFPQKEMAMSSNYFSEAIQLNMIGMAFVSVVLNNHKYRFLLDTGAQVSCVHESLIESVYKTYDIDVADSIGTTSKMSMTVVEALQVFNRTLYHWPVIVLKSNQMSTSVFGYELFHLDGIIGWDFLKLIDFEIDYKHQVIKSVNEVPETYESNMVSLESPSVLVTNEKGHLLVFSLDTGSKTSWLNKRLLESESLKLNGIKEQNNLTLHGIQRQTIQMVKSFTIYVQNKALSYQNIKVSNHSILNGSMYDGMIGYDALKHHKVGFINSRQYFYIK